ncbi:hypothetical protein [Deinococcus sp.]|uniref:hypothetical protein n=1 Tax=Deinococcus sp. TaxID=47478 RepID=UPI0025F0EA01|nr:hypothetical protein [Deinococcus sp.]
MLPFLPSGPAHSSPRSLAWQSRPTAPALHPLTRALLEDLAADDPEVAESILQALHEAGNVQALLNVGLSHPSWRVRERCRALLEQP